MRTIPNFPEVTLFESGYFQDHWKPNFSKSNFSRKRSFLSIHGLWLARKLKYDSHRREIGAITAPAKRKMWIMKRFHCGNGFAEDETMSITADLEDNNIGI